MNREKTYRDGVAQDKNKKEKQYYFILNLASKLYF